MDINDFGHNSFIGATGLIERIEKAEKEIQMRPIKFRAYDEETETMYYSDKCWENAEATFVCESEGTLKCYVPETIDATHDEPKHIVGRELSDIMQFTGLKDKNGESKDKDIYEGDIVTCTSGQPKVVEFHIAHHQCGFNIGNGYHKIIGNIYQNPELMEQK